MKHFLLALILLSFSIKALESTNTSKSESVEINLDVNNRGTRYIGPWLTQLDAKLNNQFGKDEVLGFGTLQGFENNSLQSYFMDYEHPLPQDGLKFYVNGKVSYTRPRSTLRIDNSRTYPKILNVGLRQSLLSSVNDTVSMALELSIKANRREDRRIGTVSKDRTRTLRGIFSYGFSDVFKGENGLDIKIGKGIPSLGGSRNSAPSKTRGSSAKTDFWKAEISFDRNQTLANNFNIGFWAQGQLVDKKVVMIETAKIQTPPYRRFFPNINFFGDSGLEYKIKLAYQIPNKVLNPELDTLTLYTFYSSAHMWRRSPRGQNVSKKLQASSLHFGLKGDFYKNFNFFIEQSFPFKRRIGSTSINQITYVGLRHKISF